MSEFRFRPEDCPGEARYLPDGTCPDCGWNFDTAPVSPRKIRMREPAIVPTHEGADAFWKYWRENGETHKHGYYESTWGAINAALRVAGVTTHVYTQSDEGA